MIRFSETSVAASSRDLLAELGVRRVVNAAGTYTGVGGSRMDPEVVAAWTLAAGASVRLEELQGAVNRRIAGAIGAEAALVTSGAAPALTVGTAACVTQGDPERISRLPDATGMPNEVVIQRSHRFTYDHAVRSCGVRLVEVETAAELDAAITDRTAMLLFLNLARERGQIGPDEWIAAARRHALPTLVDCAADVPPIDTVRTALAQGFDLVAVSGGKAIGGPQNGGLLLGRADLLEAAALNSGPNADVVGRGMKVTKETLLAMLVAVERFLDRDWDAASAEWERRTDVLGDALLEIDGVRVERYLPPIANRAPHLSVRWDETRIARTLAAVRELLRTGDPSIEVVPEFPGIHEWAANGPADALNLAVWTLQPGEVEVVAGRLAEILREARVGGLRSPVARRTARP
jgi:D-glucosaminate-6-phosphate ammonia-lyase